VNLNKIMNYPAQGGTGELGIIPPRAGPPANRGRQVNWEKIGFVAGSGNSGSVKEYSFTDIPNHSSIQSFNHSFRYRQKR